MADAEEPQPDPVEGEGEKNEKSDAKKSSFPKRYIVAIMIFLGICVQYALRVNLSVAIGAMCNNHTIEQNGFTIQKVRFLAVKGDREGGAEYICAHSGADIKILYLFQSQRQQKLQRSLKHEDSSFLSFS